MNTRIAIAGAGGRMGQALIEATLTGPAPWPLGHQRLAVGTTTPFQNCMGDGPPRFAA